MLAGINKVIVATERKSDLLWMLEQVNPRLTVIMPNELHRTDLDRYDSIVVLGGVQDKPLLLPAQDRVALETQIANGKRVFVEFVGSIGNVYYDGPVNTRFDRLAVASEGLAEFGLSSGMLIDDQAGARLKPYDYMCSHRTPLLQYVRAHAHDRMEWDERQLDRISDRALWFDEPDNLLICSFRLANFIKARFSPQQAVVQLMNFIVQWVMGAAVELPVVPWSYTTRKPSTEQPLDEQIAASATKAMSWFERSGILVDEGRGGVLEGIGTEIDADGKQRINTIRRVDCIGEASLAYYLQGKLNADDRSFSIHKQLNRYIFPAFIRRSDDHLHGMMSWTEEAWGVCYQDDVARAIIPQLLTCLYEESDENLDLCVDALHFLVRTTGNDGTRIFRTDNLNLPTKDKMKELRETPGRLPSAHYNAYYYAALLLAYKLTGIESFRETAVLGMETLLAVYPETIREQSETQEYCRLILPLSWLIWVTGDSRYQTWLYRVTNDLQRFRHESGAYLEWDEGYKAAMRHEVGQGECSLLSANGDPIVDLLYSNNWLPIGWIQAYFVTGDEYFKELWESTAYFMLSSQLHSDNPSIDGAWARAYDVQRDEVFGSPADLGWGPWSIESGWTVAEISSGLLMGLLEKKLKPYYVSGYKV